MALAEIKKNKTRASFKRDKIKIMLVVGKRDREKNCKEKRKCGYNNKKKENEKQQNMTFENEEIILAKIR